MKMIEKLFAVVLFLTVLRDSSSQATGSCDPYKNELENPSSVCRHDQWDSHQVNDLRHKLEDELHKFNEHYQPDHHADPNHRHWPNHEAMAVIHTIFETYKFLHPCTDTVTAALGLFYPSLSPPPDQSATWMELEEALAVGLPDHHAPFDMDHHERDHLHEMLSKISREISATCIQDVIDDFRAKLNVTFHQVYYDFQPQTLTVGGSSVIQNNALLATSAPDSACRQDQWDSQSVQELRHKLEDELHRFNTQDHAHPGHHADPNHPGDIAIIHTVFGIYKFLHPHADEVTAALGLFYPSAPLPTYQSASWVEMEHALGVGSPGHHSPFEMDHHEKEHLEGLLNKIKQETSAACILRSVDHFKAQLDEAFHSVYYDFSPPASTTQTTIMTTTTTPATTTTTLKTLFTTVPAATPSTAASLVTSTGSKTVAPITSTPGRCAVCDGLNCLLGDPTKDCPSPGDLCYTRVLDTMHGREIERGCMSQAQCDMISLDLRCHNVEAVILPSGVSCQYCCNVKNCNDPPTLYPITGLYIHH